ncbi:cyclin dependent kinase inhibitor 1Ca [Parambassis ranga]|uniref:Cyclin dependent kinase inhibitor 1Ca n=1 Tax=Parambassis ranga TaxID=210632 RepID=A0A6P7HQT6_9TELE|nr:cyclin-dependent kinase inhibitor 1-like [Parambassis ranga]
MDAIKRRVPVCRRLFGPVDHDQLRRDLKEKLREITEEDSRRWNFNFQSETPLPGRFQWEEIPADCTAQFYQVSAHQKDADSAPNIQDECRLSDREEGAGTDQENCSSISNTLKCPAELTPVRRKRTLSKVGTKSRDNNARITDFFVKRRRTTETKSIQGPFHSSEAAQCKTIR